MADLILTPPNGPTARRRGRPPGVKNKRSLDLGRYIEATFGGMTPGQQAAQICMVSPRDLREARADAKDLGLVFVDLPPVMLAMVVKAKKLARAIGCETKEAWLLLSKEREGLMAYIHQKQAQAAPTKAGELGVVYMIPEDSEQLLITAGPVEDDQVEFVEESPDDAA